MKPDHFARLKDLLFAASELPERARAAFLDKACAGDPGLRAEIESLLARGAATLDILKTGGVLPSDPVDLADSSGPERFVVPTDAVDRTLSHYEIRGELGRGGMATVYDAVDLESEEPVALKVLLPVLAADAKVRRRFLREAHAGMALDHPGIVRVFEAGEAEGRPYITMERLGGRTLRELLEAGPLKVSRVVDIGRQVSDVLATAHEKGIVHRDIKPRNIMVENGDVKVMDFGIAQVVEASVLTGTGEIMGTLYYMSPEQAMGSRVDGRSDIFSLGVVLYELLTGRRPFEGDHPGAVIHAILHSDPLRPGELRQGVPEEVDHVVFKALRKQPRDRYQRVEELGSDLEGLRGVLGGGSYDLIATGEVFEGRSGGIYSALVGREGELGRLEGHVEGMLRGEGGMVLLSGEAGIGKSRLAWELGRKAKGSGARVLVGRCHGGGGDIPYQPAFDVVRAYLALQGVKDVGELAEWIEERASHLAGRLGVMRAFLFMEGEESSSPINKEQIWDTVTELVKVISRDRPVVVHLEDLHWADRPMLNLLTYLSRNLRGERVLIVGTYRPEELVEGEERGVHPLSRALKGWRDEGLYEEVRLERLGAEATREVIASIFPESDFSEGFIELIHRETEGNPLFILEVLKLLRSQGVIAREDGVWKSRGDTQEITIPGRVSDVIRSRLEALEGVEREMVEVASVAGPSFHSDTLCHCLALSRIAVLRGLRHLEEGHHLVHASDLEYHFDHGKIRDVVYGGLMPELRVEYHRLIAEHLEGRYAEDDEYAGRIAHHLVEAGQDREALPYLQRAGEHAKKVFANEEAIDHFGRGIGIADRHLAERPETDLERAKIALLKGRAAVRILIGRTEKAREDYTCLEEITRGLGEEKERADALDGLGNTLRDTGYYEAALRYYEGALKLRREIGDSGGEGVSLNHVGIIHTHRGDYEEALKYFEESLEIRREIGDRKGEAGSLNNIGIIHTHRGNSEAALRYYEEALKIRKEIGDRYGGAGSLYNIGLILRNRGDSEAALRYQKEALKIKREIGDREGEGASLGGIGNVYADRGDSEAALRYHEEALKIRREIGDRQGEASSLNNIGIIHADRGDSEAALRYYKESLEIDRETGDREGEGRSLISIGDLHRVQGDYEAALQYFEEVLEIMRKIGNRKLEGISLHNIGLIHRDRGAYHKALRRLAQAIAIQTEIEDRPKQLASQQELCSLWVDLGDRGKARAAWEKARGLAGELGTRRTKAWSRIVAGRVEALEVAGEEAMTEILAGLAEAREIQEADAVLEGLLAAARLEIGMGNDPGARKHAEEALDLASESGRKPVEAHAHLLLARIHLTGQELKKAKSHARSAAEIAEACGERPLLWQALHALGKVHMDMEQYPVAGKDIMRAREILGEITSNLSDDMKVAYRYKEEVEELEKDWKILQSHRPD